MKYWLIIVSNHHHKYNSTIVVEQSSKYFNLSTQSFTISRQLQLKLVEHIIGYCCCHPRQFMAVGRGSLPLPTIIIIFCFERAHYSLPVMVMLCASFSHYQLCPSSEGAAVYISMKARPADCTNVLRHAVHVRHCRDPGARSRCTPLTYGPLV